MLHRVSFFALILFAGPVAQLVAGTENVIPPRIIISVRDQKLMVIENGQRAGVYSISTSKFGLGDRWGSMATPIGWLQVAEKIGDHAPPGAVFHNRRFTGEILPPNAPGRDPIVTRIIWLRGLERSNANAFNRGIYIHGTPEEKIIGKPASYGCVRMSSKDVTEVYSQLPIGSLVRIIPDSLPKLPKLKGSPAKVIFTADAPQGKTVPPSAKATSPRTRVSATAATHPGLDA
ncbi:MAG: L,D-transpeptidase [Chthoniobacterales bacterium]|nr:L,D-transpeptidase [Chthoniobacterales bacterium]